MKRTLLLICMLVFTLSFSYADGSKYKVNADQVEAVFETAIEVDFSLNADYQGVVPENMAVFGEKDPVIAFALATLFGYLGVHRLYLGTKPIVFIAYLLTAGGCGVVAAIDWVFLLMGLINDDIGSYIGNEEFFMWKGKL